MPLARKRRLGRRPAFTDRPHGLIGDYDAAGLFARDAGDGGPSLARQNLGRSAGFVVVEFVTDADEWSRAVSQSRRHFERNGFVRFTEIGAALAKPDFRDRRAAVDRHCARDLAGPGPGLRQIQILHADRNARAREARRSARRTRRRIPQSYY